MTNTKNRMYYAAKKVILHGYCSMQGVLIQPDDVINAKYEQAREEMKRQIPIALRLIR